MIIVNIEFYVCKNEKNIFKENPDQSLWEFGPTKGINLTLPGDKFYFIPFYF